MPSLAGPANRSEIVEKQETITGILRSYRGEIRPPGEGLPVEVRSMLGYVHEHLFSPDLNVAAVRRSCRLGNNNVSTRFRCAVGLGLREYIEARRIAAAKRLLYYEDLEIYLIAMSVGYENPETFCRAFRRRVGCTASEWRSTSSRTDPPATGHTSDVFGSREPVFEDSLESDR